MTTADTDLQNSGFRLNVEIKARCTDHEAVRAVLASLGSRKVGLDHQVDTYFKVPNGRLKLREGSIENSLIHYHRPDQSGPKTSDVLLYRVDPDPSLKDVLARALGVLVVVDKQREIHFVNNVKIHLDDVSGLGTFLEIEAIDADGSHSEGQLQEQCQTFMDHLGVKEADLLDVSYSDMLMNEAASMGVESGAESGAASLAENRGLANSASGSHHPFGVSFDSLTSLDSSIVKVWRLKTGLFLGVLAIGVLIWDILNAFQPDRWMPFGVWSMLAVAVAGSMAFWIPPLRYRYWGYELRDEELLLVRGIFNRTHTIIPLRRIQHLDVSQDIFEREFDVAKLIVHTAGTRSSDVILPGLHQDVAEELRDEMKQFITDQAL